MAKQFLLLLSILTTWNIGLGQRNSYSLQSAVDALHRRENQLALKENNNNNNNPSPRYASLIDEQKYWNRDDVEPEVPVSSYHGNREQLNKLLANYLAREEEEHDNSIYPPVYPPDYDEDDYRLDDRKRSVFRERDVSDLPYQSVFREREVDLQPDLTEEFLRETENQRNLDREQNYREQLRRIWEKYQQQENEIEHELFDENEKKRSSVVIPPQMYYPPFMAKKSYSSPLPWLPASRRKRFPVSKRSPKSYDDGNTSGGTNDKINKDLAAIFGEPVEEKKKRSSGDLPNTTMKPEQKSQNPLQTNAHQHEHENHDDDDNDEHDDHEHNNEHDDHEHDEHEEHEGHDEDDDDDHEHEFDESKEEDDKKKKRATKRKRSNLEIIKEDQIIPGDLTDLKKKSVQWSKYFGMDRRKKSEYSPSKYENYNQYENSQKLGSGLDEEKIENMDQKLKAIEDLIIDEMVKYTGAHEGIRDMDEIRKLKDHVVSRLITAYSIEKMRRALDKLKLSYETEQHLKNNEIESDSSDDIDKKKRVAIKKEKVEFDNSNHKIEAATEKVVPEEPNNNLNDNDEDKKKKKMKKNEYPSGNAVDSDFEEELGAGHFYDPMLEGHVGGGGGRDEYSTSNQCPLLDSIEKRCRDVDLLSGDIHQALLPICGIHQLCYLCGTKQTACDFQYLSDADSICGHNNDCQSAARSALMILRGTPIPHLGPRECAKNSCLYHAMREIGL